MNIAWFTHRYHPCVGGSENYGRNVVGRYVRGGHEVDVFTSDALDLWYFTDPARRRVEAPAVERVDGATVRRFAVKHLPMQRYVGRLLSYAPHWPTRCTKASYMPILLGLDKVRGAYDLVFSLGFPYTIFSHAALRTARAAGAPLVLTPFLHLATPGDAVNRHYTKPHQVRLLREADLVVVQTAIEEDAVAGWGVPRGRLLRLGMAVDHDAVTGGDGPAFRARHGIPAGRKLVGYLGVNDPNKGTNDLVAAVARLNETRAEPIHLILAGGSSPDFERFAAALPAETSRWLTRTGVLADDDRRHFYDALDAFAMPSRTDSFGIVFLEAWANGLPVVAAAAGGVAEVVDHDRTGLLVPFGDVERLASALSVVVDDPAAASRLGDAGRELVSRRGFTWDDRFAALADRAGGLISARQRAVAG